MLDFKWYEPPWWLIPVSLIVFAFIVVSCKVIYFLVLRVNKPLAARMLALYDYITKRF